MYTCACVGVFSNARRGCSISWGWSHGHLWATWYGNWAARSFGRPASALFSRAASLAPSVKFSMVFGRVSSRDLIKIPCPFCFHPVLLPLPHLQPLSCLSTEHRACSCLLSARPTSVPWYFSPALSRNSASLFGPLPPPHNNLHVSSTPQSVGRPNHG